MTIQVEITAGDKKYEALCSAIDSDNWNAAEYDNSEDSDFDLNSDPDSEADEEEEEDNEEWSGEDANPASLGLLTFGLDFDRTVITEALKELRELENSEFTVKITYSNFDTPFLTHVFDCYDSGLEHDSGTEIPRVEFYFETRTKVY